MAAPELLQACQAGLARCTLHMGDVRSGRQLALAVASPTLWRECALILETRGQQQVRRGSSKREQPGSAACPSCDRLPGPWTARAAYQQCCNADVAYVESALLATGPSQ